LDAVKEGSSKDPIRGELVTFKKYREDYVRRSEPMLEVVHDKPSRGKNFVLTPRRGQYRKYAIAQVEELVELVTTKGKCFWKQKIKK